MKKIVIIFFVAVGLCVLTSINTAQQNKAEQLYQQALFDMEGKGDYAKAIESFTLVMTKFPKEKVTAAKALLNIGRCYEKLGKNEAVKAYERIIKEFKDQTQVVAEARARLALLKQPADAIQSKRSNRQIHEDVNALGAPSPDGRYLSFTDVSRNCLGIYDLKTKERKLFANPDSSLNWMYVYSSFWSPDGKQIAYQFGGSGLYGDNQYKNEFHLINIDGTGHRMLCKQDDSDSVHVWLEDWSKDGKYLLAWFAHFYPNSPISEYADLTLVSVDDGTTKFIKRVNTWNWRLSNKMFFSPDSRFISYSAPTEIGGKTCDVFVISVEGGKEINISQNPANDIVVGWEPNGNRLLYSSDRSGNYNLLASQIVNGQLKGLPELIMNNIGKIYPMGMTSNGSFYYSVESGKERIDDFNTDSNIYLASLDPQTGKILSPPVLATMNNNGFNHLGSWSPDGKNLLYNSQVKNNKSPKWFILTPETGSEKEVKAQLDSNSFFGGSSWFPDGKHLASYIRMSNKESGIYKVEIETGKIIPLVTSKDTTFWSPSVSPDGKILFFESNLKAIYSYDLEKKERKLLYQKDKDEYLIGRGLSPDGKYLAFLIWVEENSEAIMVMPSNGGEPREIFRSDNVGFFSKFSGPRWSPDGKYIYFVKWFSKKNDIELFRVSTQGGTPEPIGIVNSPHSFSIRPDGKEIAFCAPMESKTEIWVLDNVFAEKEEVKK